MHEAPAPCARRPAADQELADAEDTSLDGSNADDAWHLGKVTCHRAGESYLLTGLTEH